MQVQHAHRRIQQLHTAGGKPRQGEGRAGRGRASRQVATAAPQSMPVHERSLAQHAAKQVTGCSHIAGHAEGGEGGLTIPRRRRHVSWAARRGSRLALYSSSYRLPFSQYSAGAATALMIAIIAARPHPASSPSANVQGSRAQPGRGQLGHRRLGSLK